MPPIGDLDRMLNALEDQADDELALLESTGPEFFSTAQLWRLRGQWEVKNRLFGRFQRWLNGLVALSPVWLVAWALFSFFGWTYVSLLFLLLFPVSFLVFLFGLFFFRRFFRGKGHLDRVGELILGELRRRAQKGEGLAG